MPKIALRKTMLARRRQMDRPECESASALIQEALTALPIFNTARVVALYHPMDNEVATSAIHLLAREAGKKVVLPAVNEGLLQFRAVDSFQHLAPGAYGIPEPSTTAALVDVEAIDLVVVPGIAFDLVGRRIGYGKGYYDRTFHRFEGQGRLVGLCYDFQLLDRILGEPHDVEMDLILTEKRIIATRN
jgi:5-formyltetrahydrofolate cyclo-ligase